MLHPLAISTFNTAAWNALLWTIIYAVVGILLTVAGYKIFDWITPIDVEKELAEKQNIAVAIVMGAVIIAVAVVIHATISAPM